eukprot:3201708-Pyramimonas_sp.AAC.1
MDVVHVGGMRGSMRGGASAIGQGQREPLRVCEEIRSSAANAKIDELTTSGWLPHLARGDARSNRIA